MRVLRVFNVAIVNIRIYFGVPLPFAATKYSEFHQADILSNDSRRTP
jgi:hypothetical protein